MMNNIKRVSIERNGEQIVSFCGTFCELKIGAFTARNVVGLSDEQRNIAENSTAHALDFLKQKGYTVIANYAIAV